MSQKLILPINQTCVTASYKSPAYLNLKLGPHYGTDMISSNGSTKLWSPGKGTVLAVGNCSLFGNYIVLKMPDCANWKTGKSSDVIIRMYHLHSISVKSGQGINKDTVLGYYGNTGTYTYGAHLHIEIDTDILHPYYTPSLTGVSGIFKGSSTPNFSNDKTMSNPLEWLHCKISAPDSQTYATSKSMSAYIVSSDSGIPKIN